MLNGGILICTILRVGWTHTYSILPFSTYHIPESTSADMFSSRVIFPATLIGLGSALQVCPVAYYNPILYGGSMLDNAGAGLGEPLNARFFPFDYYCPLTHGLTGHHLSL